MNNIKKQANLHDLLLETKSHNRKLFTARTNGFCSSNEQDGISLNTSGLSIQFSLLDADPGLNKV